jgi:hypothetical protein
MSTPLWTQGAPDESDFIVSWLSPLLRSAIERDSDDELPFALVQRVAGEDEIDCGTDDPVIQIDILARGADGEPAVSVAKKWADKVHRRMMLLGRTDDDVTLSDSRAANCDFIECLMKPVRMPYTDDQIARFVGRYLIGLSHVTA